MKRLLPLCALLAGLTTQAQLPSYVPTDGLVGYWGFNGDANDESGNGNDGIVNGASLSEGYDGAYNSAYYFDGEDDNILLPQTTSLESGAISLWFIRTVDEVGYLFDCRPNSSTAGMACYLGENSFLEYGMSSQGYYDDLVQLEDEDIALSEWHHMVCSHVEGFNQLYLDGQLIHEGEGGEYEYFSYSNLLLGRRYNDDFWLNGGLDNVGVWNRALTEEEILALYNAEPAAPGCTDPTACNYNPDATEDDGSCTYTYSGNPVSSTLFNSGGFEGLWSDFTPYYDLDVSYVFEVLDTILVSNPTTPEQVACGDTNPVRNFCGIQLLENGEAPPWEWVGEIICRSEINWQDPLYTDEAVLYPGNTYRLYADLNCDSEYYEGALPITNTAIFEQVGPLYYRQGPAAQSGNWVTTDKWAYTPSGIPYGFEYFLICNVQGCTAPTACNYNAYATEDDGSCFFANAVFDCEGNCQIDLNNNGVCDQLETGGCSGPGCCGNGTLWDPVQGVCIAFDQCPADVNEDQVVDALDILALIASYGSDCP